MNAPDMKNDKNDAIILFWADFKIKYVKNPTLIKLDYKQQFYCFNNYLKYINDFSIQL